MSRCQLVDTPMEEGSKWYVESNQIPTGKGKYHRLMRRLMYLAHIRPNLAYVSSIVS